MPLVGINRCEKSVDLTPDLLKNITKASYTNLSEIQDFQITDLIKIKNIGEKVLSYFIGIKKVQFIPYLRRHRILCIPI